MKNLPRSIFLAMVVCACAARAGDFEDGAAAHSKKDYMVALQKYRKAALQGDANARFNLGLMYHNGEGITKDDAEAIRWFRLSAAQGNTEAQYFLGVSYYYGWGVAQDYLRAHLWFNLAAVKGDINIAKVRDMVAEKLTPQHVAQAQKMARECLERNLRDCN